MLVLVESLDACRATTKRKPNRCLVERSQVVASHRDHAAGKQAHGSDNQPVPSVESTRNRSTSLIYMSLIVQPWSGLVLAARTDYTFSSVMARHQHQSHANGASNGNGSSVANRVMSRAQLQAQADHVAASVLGVSSRREAFRRLENGDLAGTAVEAELKMLRRLMQRA
jgi:hypothetical protein